ncbi:PREDICTED: protein farnesyltransferase subunit beta [Dufourea novaeangliae]|uniref:Protein farnesyltransferase subunit beta n=1 Tax=Dufourea novaeangliae TaxID=178035 RepID=A0A154PH95_DUFNO|nr:PREDICTED: protein farnesyltransferase subunit beta [Dufourea novaeangliae]KZC10550.1 Protein farnesyltransferase subunit beta [Dufourea novaeangliae]
MWNSMFNELDEPRVRSYAEILEQKQDNEGHRTETSFEQEHVESQVLKLFKLSHEPFLMRQKHIKMLTTLMTHLDKTYESLDCSRPWLCYWILHCLQILGHHLNDDEYSKIAGFLAKCQSPEGGFGGGPGQYPHLASTYAAVNALCIIGTHQAYQVIDRTALKSFLTSLHNEDGSFNLHADGESDLRGIYCALAVAKLTNVYTPEMFKETEDWIANCQTWEGGFGGCPGMEAHGGYTYCGLAALVLLGKTDFCHLKSLLAWIVNKQMHLEGGFQGRSNKIVDGCYSFWQGGTFPLIHAILTKQGKVFNSNYWLFNQEALQEYLLICCQHPHGGLRDKPERNPDMYHTCYALSGLSIAQNSPKPLIIGSQNTNLVNITHPVYNLVLSCAVNALKYFNRLEIPA